VLTGLHMSGDDLIDAKRLTLARTNRGTWTNPVNVQDFLLIVAYTLCAPNDTDANDQGLRQAFLENREELAEHITQYEREVGSVHETLGEHTTQIRGIKNTVNRASATNVSLH
jgi:hypothetical protein